MRYRSTLAGLSFLVLGALCWASPIWADDLSGDDPIVQIHRIARDTDKAASQARQLGWIAVSLGAVNLVLVACVAAKFFPREMPRLPVPHPRVAAIRRRQQNIAHDLALLNNRLDNYFRAAENERKGLAEALQAINERVRVASEEADQTLAEAGPEPPIG